MVVENLDVFSLQFGSPTYELSKCLASILKLLQNNNEYSVKNAKEYADFVNNQTMEADEQIVSFDVTALFTSIPVDLALDIVDRKLREIHEWELHTRLTQSQIMFLLTFVLTNSYFTFEGIHYHQVFGCAMGSPVSAAIAELVMQEVEKIALNTSNIKPRWWKRYVDDSSACLKTKDIQVFHDHLNSINPNIQFTVELPSVSSQNLQTIAFLDTRSTVGRSGNITVSVHRKATHTNKYLDFASHSPAQSKRAVVKCLIDRAETIPSNDTEKDRERQQVINDLKINGYTDKFIEKCRAPIPPAAVQIQDTDTRPKTFATLPYVKGVSEQVKNVLNKANIKTAFKPILTLAHYFRKPKDRPKETKTKGIVYKVKCRSCDFTYIGETKRSWNSRGGEHKPGTNNNKESAIKDHAETTDHDIDTGYVEILEKNVNNWHKRIFLESWHSTIDKNAVNERKPFPSVYKTLLKP